MCREEVIANRSLFDELASDMYEELLAAELAQVSNYVVALLTLIAEITARDVDADLSAVLLEETELTAEEVLDWAQVVESCVEPEFEELLRRLIAAEAGQAVRDVGAEELSKKLVEEAIRSLDDKNKAQVTV